MSSVSAPEQTARAGWKKGFEIELLAPRGRSRRDLADHIARRASGEVRTCFYPQSEPSLVPGLPVFENLVLGFDVSDANDERIALLVDDLTLQADLDKRAAPLPGWIRVLSDDRRLLALVQRHCDPTAPLDRVLRPMAELFGSKLDLADGNVSKISDADGRSVAMAAQLPGERERPCEIITPPIEGDARAVLEALLGDAAALGFTVPAEAAVHVHFDAAPLCSARVIARLVDALDRYGPALRDHVGTNSRCSRLAPWSKALVDCVRSDRFRTADWPAARAMLAETRPTKYCDFNLFNIAMETPGKHTFEVRILPGSMDVDQILGQADLFEQLLLWASGSNALDCPAEASAFIEMLQAGPG